MTGNVVARDRRLGESVRADREADPMAGYRVLRLLGAFGRRAHEAIASRVGEELADNTTVAVLCELRLSGSSRPHQLQAVAGLTSGGMTKQLDRLERHGLISRAFGEVPGDRRAILITLTERGEDAAAQLSEAILGEFDAVHGLAVELDRALRLR